MQTFTLLIVAASIPFMALYNGGAAIFRTMGNSKVTMQISIIMNVINIGGNAILIYGFHRGTEGGCDSDTGVKDDGGDYYNCAIV